MQSLSKFHTEPFINALKAFFEELQVPVNYLADEPATASDILGDNYKPASKAHELIGDVFALGMVNDAIFEGTGTFRNVEQVKNLNTDYDGLLLLGITLKTRPDNLLPTRSQLAEITRAFNRTFPYTPVTIIFKYNGFISFANSERVKYKQEWREGEKIGKVTLLKDVDLEHTHRAHHDILAELGKHKATSFNELYQYWQKTLSTKELNNAFYNDLFKWYLWAKDHASFPNDNNEEAEKYLSESLIRFISRLLFVWFMKEKKLIANDIFNKLQLNAILKNFDPNSQQNSYYKAILQNLFFATLNVPIENRKWIDGHKKNKAQVGDPLIYRYENEFTDSKNAIEGFFMQIPFLNGGLFDCLDDRENNVFVDGFTKNEKKQPQMPNLLFFGEKNNIDLSRHFADDAKDTKEQNKWKNQTVTGIIDLLHNYKFTIEENTPLEVDVALDPELLGKVFENLLASFNPETKTTARKQTGSFYTPREIVNYMVDESLKHHLSTHLPDNKTDIDNLFQSLVNPSNQAFNKTAVQKLFECKILDPACGSGAFPMGILHKMVELMTLLDPQNQFLKEIEGQKLDFLIQNAQLLSETSFRNQTVEMLQKQKEILQSAEYDYVRKLYIIENCIYGVDIQPIAIQISKLRFFISLLVEQKKDLEQENYGIQPLPNMDFKLVAANTLIGTPQEDRNIGLFAGQNEFFDQFDRLAHDYFTLHTPEAKKQKKAEIIQLIQTKVAEKTAQIEREASVGKKAEVHQQSLKLWQSYPNLFKEKSVEFFDIPYFFPKVKEGFDVVIGNPPYVQLQKITDIATILKAEGYKTFERTGDIYMLFIEKGTSLLKVKGNLIFITNSTWLRTAFGKSLKKFFCNETSLQKLVDLSDCDLFENAAVLTTIIHLEKGKKGLKEAHGLRIRKTEQQHVNHLNSYFNENSVPIHSFLPENAWSILDNLKFKIKDSVIKQGVEINKWGLSISRGILTGLNEAFVIDGAKKDELIKADPKSAEILKPIIRGRDVVKYRVAYDDLWLIGTFPKLKIEIGKYPVIEKYLLDFGKEKLVQDGTGRKKTGNKWFETQDQIGYWEEFEKPKIIFPNMTKDMPFYYDEDSFYTNQKCYIITGDHLLYLTAIFNSKLFDYCFRSNFPELLGGVVELSKVFFERIPIKKAEKKIEDLLGAGAHKIINAKKANPQADTLLWEAEIDARVFHLYDLTEEEILQVLNSLPSVTDAERKGIMVQWHKLSNEK
jgi:tRNA1(Val) A37 N6-methylase TrmN6